MYKVQGTRYKVQGTMYKLQAGKERRGEVRRGKDMQREERRGEKRREEEKRRGEERRGEGGYNGILRVAYEVSGTRPKGSGEERGEGKEESPNMQECKCIKSA